MKNNLFRATIVLAGLSLGACAQHSRTASDADQGPAYQRVPAQDQNSPPLDCRADPPPMVIRVGGSSATARMGGALAVDTTYIDGNVSGMLLGHTFGRAHIHADYIVGLLQKTIPPDIARGRSIDYSMRAKPIGGADWNWNEWVKALPLKSDADVQRVMANGKGKPVDLIIYLDGFYHDFKVFDAFGTNPKQTKDIEAAKARTLRVIDAFARNSREVWVGGPFSSDIDSKTGEEKYKGPGDARKWLAQLFASNPQKYGNVHLYDLVSAYKELMTKKQWTFPLNGQVFKYHEVISGDDWHPNSSGNKLIARHLMYLIGKSRPCWAQYMPYDVVDEDLTPVEGT